MLTTKPRLTVAISHYDRFVPLLEGTADAAGFELDVRHVSQSNEGRYGNERHERMIRDGEFDVAELSLSSYLMARARGLPFTAIPIFPRRLFSLSQIWINSEGAIREPRDLIGQRVGLSTFQTTLSVLARGDLQDEYGVPWRGIRWVVSKDETIDFTPEPGVVIERAPADTDIGRMLLDREIAAIFRPHPPKAALQGAATIRRLFDDPKAEEVRYFHKLGFYPIMHVVALRQDVVDAHPEAPRALLEMFERANRTTERYYDDPNWSRLAWGRLHLEEERRLLGHDVWPTGVRRNRANLEMFIRYAHDQGLIDRSLEVDALFEPSTLDT